MYDLYNNYKVTDGAVNAYRRYVKNNKDDSYFVIFRKLIRNIVLGDCIFDSERYRSYTYGNLEMHIDMVNKTIYWLYNAYGDFEFNVNLEHKEWLERNLPGFKTIKEMEGEKYEAAM